jgi:hypothetical protein
MPLSGWPYPQTSKPPRGSRIDPTHPWAQGLKAFYALNDGAGSTCCDSGPGKLTLAALNYGSTNPWGAGSFGQGLSMTTAGQGMQAIVPTALQCGLPITLATAFQVIGTPSSSAVIFEISYESSNVAPFVVACLQYDFTNAFEFGWNSGGTQESIASSAPDVPPGSVHVLAGTVTPTSTSLWLDGVEIASSSSTSAAPDWTATSTLCFGSFSGFTSTTPNLLNYWGGFWNRAFAATELAAMTGSPGAIWPLFAPAPIRSIPWFQGHLYNVAASGGTVAGGSASSSSTYPESASGGAVAGGSASYSSTYAESGSSGAIAGGSASYSSTYAESGSSGAIAGGSASYSSTYAESGSSGAIGGGIASWAWIATPGSSGGIVASAVAPVSPDWTTFASGGVVAGGTSQGVIPALTFRQTLRAKLGAIPELTAIVGGAIYVGALPQTHDLGRDGPALTYSISTYPRNHVLAGADGTASARVQFSAWSYQQSKADAIALALWDALDGPPANPWAGGGVGIMSVSHQDEVDLPEPPKTGSDQWTYQIASEYLIRHRTGTPTLS